MLPEAEGGVRACSSVATHNTLPAAVHQCTGHSGQQRQQANEVRQDTVTMSLALYK